jgi:hypothetical protein
VNSSMGEEPQWRTSNRGSIKYVRRLVAGLSFVAIRTRYIIMDCMLEEMTKFNEQGCVTEGKGEGI